MQFFREIGSTNDVVKAAARKGEPAGFLAVALAQTAGYGRQGRTWSSPPGGLYLSLLLRTAKPLEQVPSLAIIAALAVRQELVAGNYVNAPEKVQIKWPNDIVVPVQGEGAAFRKMVGISSEVVTTSPEQTICVGIGINVLRTEAVKTDGRYQPVYVSDLAGSRFASLVNPFAVGELSETGAQELAQHIADTLLSYQEQWERDGFASFGETFDACSYLTGKAVALTDSIGAVHQAGIARGIDAQGCLLVETSQGIIETVRAGEAHLV